MLFVRYNIKLMVLNYLLNYFNVLLSIVMFLSISNSLVYIF